MQRGAGTRRRGFAWKLPPLPCAAAVPVRTTCRSPGTPRPRPVNGQPSCPVPSDAVTCAVCGRAHDDLSPSAWTAQACGAAVPGNSAPTGARRPCAHSIPTVGWYRSTAGMALPAQIFPWGGHPRARSGGGRGRRTCRPLRNLPAPPAGWAPPRDRYNKGWK